MRRARILFTALLAPAAIIQLLAWGGFHGSVDPAAAPGPISGFAFSPYAREQDSEDLLTRDALREDLALVATKARSVRTYAVTGGLEHVPAEAARYGLDVTLGLWLDGDERRDAIERENAIAIANRHGNVQRILVGNEAVYREDATPAALIAAMDAVRAEVSVPVGTAEPWHVWLEHPELAHAADFIGVHILPYWEGIAADEAVGYVAARMGELRAIFPEKPIVLAEMGWPSDGARIGDAVPSRANQAMVIREFLAYARESGLDSYFVLEAFDQAWKTDLEGLAGGYWGVFDAYRNPKFPWDEPVANRTGWAIWALLATVLGLIPLTLGLRLRPQLSLRAALPLVFMGQIAGAMTAVTVLLATERYFDFGDWVLWGALAAGELLLFLVLTVEFVEAAALNTRRRDEKPAKPAMAHWPKVSIHVPCSNEPPALVRQTLNALAWLDYPDFEVIVVDNNTRDLRDSEAIAAHCRALGSRFRFLHLPKSSGYKAGALNRALAVTAPDASLIAVVDSDYIVEPHWLKEAVPHFADPGTGLVQAPQDYRDDDASPFKRGLYSEYRAFFRLGMVFRAEDNAIIQHGTMTIVRREALGQAGAWDESCITEDAELGLRLFAAGWKSVYLPATMGRGLMPDDTSAYCRQRFRWAFGAMQILRRHAGILFGRADSKLGTAQRYHFVAGWLPWIGDGLGLLVAGGSIAWAALAALWPAHFEPPEAHFLLPVLAVFAARQVRLWRLYARYVESDPKRRLGAMVAGGALALSVSRAVLAGLMRKEAPFRRTPKARPAPKILRSLSAVRAETALLGALGFAAVILAATQELARLDVQLWLVVIACQAWPYLAAFILSIQASTQQPFEWRTAEEALPLGAEFKEAAE